MHILGTHMNIHTKYEVSILNPVARRAVHRRRCRMTTMHDGQIMITLARLVEYQMSQKGPKSYWGQDNPLVPRFDKWRYFGHYFYCGMYIPLCDHIGVMEQI